MVDCPVTDPPTVMPLATRLNSSHAARRSQTTLTTTVQRPRCAAAPTTLKPSRSTTAYSGIAITVSVASKKIE